MCGGKLSPNGAGLFEEDRDVVGNWNIRLRALSVPQKPANDKGLKGWS
ncbi:hypothetical protein [Thermococcus stetteri]